MSLCRCTVALFIAALTATTALAAPTSLSAYGADEAQTSVSGLSSGAFMAVQLQVAYSASIVGSGVVAGGPYYCAANNLAFTEICMGQVPFTPPNPVLMVAAARDFAAGGSIDPLSHLSKRRIYVFSGSNDDIVRRNAVDAAVAFFRQAGVKQGNIQYVNTLPAGHAMITPTFGNDCAANATPYISHCKLGSHGYDQAGAILHQVYGALHSRVDAPAGKVLEFDQRRFAPEATGMDATGFVYVPVSCSATGAHCRVHVALHGCLQSAKVVGNKFYTDTGYNNWADNNKIIVLYPQVSKTDTPANPQGCWDWWGYTGSHYADKASPQMQAIMAMVNRLAQPH